MVNGCCWLNHNDGPQSRRFIEIVRENPCIKGWFSGHFHLSHDYEDSMSLPEGNNRGACVFAQTAVMTARSPRDGRRPRSGVTGSRQSRAGRGPSLDDVAMPVDIEPCLQGIRDDAADAVDRRELVAGRCPDRIDRSEPLREGAGGDRTHMPDVERNEEAPQLLRPRAVEIREQ